MLKRIQQKLSKQLKQIQEQISPMSPSLPSSNNQFGFDLLRQFDIRCIRTEHEHEHEQGAVQATRGYGRATGQAGCALRPTSGPGATNLVTGVADANSDSTPVVFITGNVPSHLLGKTPCW